MVQREKQKETETSGGGEAETARKGPKIRKFRWQPYAGIAAAAALCLLVAIPVMNASRSAESIPAAMESPAATADSTAVDSVAEVDKGDDSTLAMDNGVQYATEAEEACESVDEAIAAGATQAAEATLNPDYDGIHIVPATGDTTENEASEARDAGDGKQNDEECDDADGDSTAPSAGQVRARMREAERLFSTTGRKSQTHRSL